MKFFNPLEDIKVTRHNLRHWQQTGATYFITFRTADALPSKLLHDLEAERAVWLETHPLPFTPDDEAEYHRRFSARLDQWLDDGHGRCLMRDPLIREHVEESLNFFQGRRYELLSYVIMPNHVHCLVTLHPDFSLEKIIFTWKRRTAGLINQKEGSTGQPFWQQDYFDRLIRDVGHLKNVVRYIRKNPAKAKLARDSYSLWESDRVKDMV